MRGYMNNKRCERGIALIMTLILLVIISVMAVSLTFVARSETWSSMNYRLMSQARDAAESGVNRTTNHLLNSYTSPAGVGADLMTNYDTTVSPVTYGGNPVILSGDSSVSSNYPVSSVQSAFDGATHGTLTAGTTNVAYKASAQLLSMREFDKYGGGKATVQTWEITSTGSVSGVQAATVTVTAKLERQASPVFTYAAFATFNGCDALNFGGGGTSSSYDSQAALSGGVPIVSNSGGNVGTNGSMSTVGNPTTIYGTLSTPRTGVGACSSTTVTAWDPSNGTVTGGLVQLPQEIVYPTPDPPSPMPPTTSVTVNTSCGLAGCTTISSKNYNLAPNSNPGFGNIAVNGGATIHLSAGTYTFNSLTLNGGSTIVVDSGPVILQIAGAGVATPLDLSGGNLTNTTGGYLPENFQVFYAGTGEIKLKGGAEAAGLLYAPNATFNFGGGGDWYGAVIGKYMTDMGGTAIHYDRRLKNTMLIPGPYTLDSFNWKKY
jgi:Tfp pilus assembly protein PilX